MEHEISILYFLIISSIMFQCKAHLVAHARPKRIACCQEGNYCNRNLSLPYYANVSPQGSQLYVYESIFVARLVAKVENSDLEIFVFQE